MQNKFQPLISTSLLIKYTIAHACCEERLQHNSEQFLMCLPKAALVFHLTTHCWLAPPSIHLLLMCCYVSVSTISARCIGPCYSVIQIRIFAWRQNAEEPFCDFRMTRVTFGVSTSLYAANMSVKQNSQSSNQLCRSLCGRWSRHPSGNC